MNEVNQKSFSIDDFAVREEGLFVRDDAGTETRVCDAIWHLGNAIGDNDGGDACAYDLLEFIDRSGERRQAMISHENAVNHPRKVFEELAKRYFAVPELELGRNQPRRTQIIAYLALCRQKPAREFLLADRMGWHRSCSSFVIGNDVIPTGAAQSIKLSGRIAGYAKKFTHSGALGDYQHNLLRRASYSSRLMTGIALALLAPLARILGLSGGLNFVGKAGIGKTTILRVAGSFYGGGPVPYFVSWDMTDNAPETLGLAFCDLPLLLDELDTLEPDASKAGGRLKAIVHRLAAGQGKARSHRAPADNSTTTEFHVVYGSTSEHRLPDFMREGGSKMTGGQAARFVDIPADVGRGLTIFESLPRNARTGETPDADRYLRRLNRACEKYYGVAGRTYLRHLVHERTTDPGALEAFLRQEMAKFETEVARHAQVDPRVRRRFAGLYAAGQLGLRYGILPSSCDWFMEAVSSCYWAAIASDPISSLSETEAAARLGKFLRTHQDRLLKGNVAVTEDTYQKAFGLVPDPKRHGNRVWVKSKVLQTSVFQPSTFQRAVDHLVKSGVIVPSGKGSMARQERVPELDIREYFYVIDPEKLRSLNNDTIRS